MFKRYAYSGQSVKANTFIGGVAGTINTAALLASKLGINAVRITNFEIRGNDIRCSVKGQYILPAYSFGGNTDITYWKDSVCYMFGFDSFSGAGAFKNAINLLYVDAENVKSIQTGSHHVFQGATKLKKIRLPRLTSWGGYYSLQLVKFDVVYAPILLTSIGSSYGNDAVFMSTSNTGKLYLNPAQATNNAGAPDADLVAAIAAGNSVIYVPNTSAPSRITNLTVGAITTTTIALNFTAPSSVNTIEKYEVEIDGVWYQDINGPGESITGLTAGTKYKNITIKARDIYYNRAEEESNAIPEVETSAIVIDIVTDFKTRVLADGGTFENETALRVFAETLVIGNTTLALAASSFKAGKIYSVLPNTVGGDATVTRATTKTRINSSGILENVPANTLSPDYSTGQARIWINPQTTLPAMNTNNFASGWNKGACEVLANTCISPDGTMNGNTFKEALDTFTQHRLYRTVNTVAGLPYVISIFVQAKDHRWIIMSPPSFSGEYACFDVLNGVIGNTNTPKARIDNIPNSTWKRISIVAVASMTGNTFPTIIASTNNQDVDGVVNYVGTNAECFNIFGCNIVQADRIAPYIDSNNVAKTVNADIVTITPPALTAKIIESLDNGAVNTVTTIPSSYQVPFGRYKSIAMTK